MGDPMKHHEMIKAVIEGAECKRPLSSADGWSHVRLVGGSLLERIVWDQFPARPGPWSPLSAWPHDTWELVPPFFVSPAEAFAAVKAGKQARFEGWGDGVFIACYDNMIRKTVPVVGAAAYRYSFRPDINELTESRWVIL